MPDTTTLLYKIDLFKGLGPKDLESFFKQVELKFYPAGSIVFAPEYFSCEQLYILKEGRVERYRLTSNGKRLVTRRILPKGVFGVMGLLGVTCKKILPKLSKIVTFMLLHGSMFWLF